MLNIQDNFPLSKVTTLQIGGPCKKFVSVKTEGELIEAIVYAKQNGLEFLVIGGGSNLLVSDEGVNKLIIKNEISGIEQDGQKIKVKSGTVLQDLVDYTIDRALSGLHKMTGIPGTVGGAVYGNAGAYGQTISDHIDLVRVFDGNQVEVFTKDQCEFLYRESIFKKNHHLILEVTFKLDLADSAELQKQSAEVLTKRLIKYPKDIKCPGSFFKNIIAETLPKGVLEKIPQEAIVYGKLPAGYLLEQVGAKGDSLDGIYIANYHANLFVNRGDGSAKNFYNLAKKYADKVNAKFGIVLEPEVQLINLSPFN